LYPAIAVVEALKELEPASEVLFLCTQREIDKEILCKAGLSFETQPVRPLLVRQPMSWFGFWRDWQGSLRICGDIMRKRRPAAVLGLGGFGSGPGLKAAARLGIATAMLNPDAVPGRANRFCRKFAGRIFVQWQESCDRFNKDDNCIVTGCPIRLSVAMPRFNEKQARRRMGLTSDKKVLVVMGGSQGGRNVNRAAVECLTVNKEEFLGDEWQVVHITGKGDFQWVEQQYKNAHIEAKVREFTDDMDMLLAVTDLAIARAGASTLAELTATAVASILLPYPYHRDQHQRHNAEVLAKAGASKIVTDYCDAKRSAEELGQAMRQCMADGQIAKMSLAAGAIGCPNAARRVAEELIAMNNEVL
jgi:UDP-N-acetylglucosamine--N-acetylmuramyl-(pentapeptide) pyrophosphoryl-undecaprenol N-acetylglucosamine transferase